MHNTLSFYFFSLTTLLLPCLFFLQCCPLNVVAGKDSNFLEEANAKNFEKVLSRLYTCTQYVTFHDGGFYYSHPMDSMTEISSLIRQLLEIDHQKASYPLYQLSQQNYYISELIKTALESFCLEQPTHFEADNYFETEDELWKSLQRALSDKDYSSLLRITQVLWSIKNSNHKRSNTSSLPSEHLFYFNLILKNEPFSLFILLVYDLCLAENIHEIDEDINKGYCLVSDPLYLSLKSQHKILSQLLIASSLKRNPSHYSPALLKLIIPQLFSNEWIDMIEELIETGPAQVLEEIFENLLFYNSILKDIDIRQKFLELSLQRMDPRHLNRVNKNGLSLLQSAILGDFLPYNTNQIFIPDPAIVQLLIDHGASSNLDPQENYHIKRLIDCLNAQIFALEKRNPFFDYISYNLEKRKALLDAYRSIKKILENALRISVCQDFIGRPRLSNDTHSDH